MFKQGAKTRAMSRSGLFFFFFLTPLVCCAGPCVLMLAAKWDVRSQSKERRPAGNRNFNRCPATSFGEQANLLRSLSHCDAHKPATAGTHQFSIRARFCLFGCLQCWGPTLLSMSAR